MINKSKDINYIREQLQCGGYKLTKQRLQIIEIMYKNNKHMTADEIYREVESKNIGLSTVYRNLMILEEVGVLKRINLPNISYYELEVVGKDKFHIHVKCIKCNKIIDINEEEISEDFCALIEKLKKKHIVTIKSTSVMLSGICNKCKMRM